MNAVTDQSCVACGTTTTTVFWRGRNRTIRKCSECGLLFVSPQPNQTQLHDELQHDYFSHNGTAGLRLELEFEKWRKPTLARIVKRIKTVKQTGSLLDVGCASGEVFEYFRNDNWDLNGVEPSRFAFERAQKRFSDNPRVHLFRGYLTEVDFDEHSFDVITVLESLMHMPNPRQELSYIRRILKDDGLLVIALPGPSYQRLRHTGLISRVLHGSRCSLTASHLFYFSLKSLTSLLKTEGFTITKVIRIGSSSYGSGIGRLARYSYVLLTKVLGTVTLNSINVSPHVLYLCQKRAHGS